MLNIVNIDEIKGLLFRIPQLTDLQQQRDPSFDDEVKKWLSELEKVLENNRIVQTGEIATLRGVVISAERGVIPQGMNFLGRSSRRKVVEAAVSYAMREAGHLVTEIIQKDIDRVSDAERMMRQLIALAKAKGINLDVPDNGNHTDALKHLWGALSADPDISPGTINVEGLVGPNDALIVLDRILTSDK